MLIHNAHMIVFKIYIYKFYYKIIIIHRPTILFSFLLSLDLGFWVHSTIHDNNLLYCVLYVCVNVCQDFCLYLYDFIIFVVKRCP
jgi:hypothetical protein